MPGPPLDRASPQQPLLLPPLHSLLRPPLPDPAALLCCSQHRQPATQPAPQPPPCAAPEGTALLPAPAPLACPWPPGPSHPPPCHACTCGGTAASPRPLTRTWTWRGWCPLPRASCGRSRAQGPSRSAGGGPPPGTGGTCSPPARQQRKGQQRRRDEAPLAWPWACARSGEGGRRGQRGGSQPPRAFLRFAPRPHRSLVPCRMCIARACPGASLASHGTAPHDAGLAWAAATPGWLHAIPSMPTSPPPPRLPPSPGRRRGLPLHAPAPSCTRPPLRFQEGKRRRQAVLDASTASARDPRGTLPRA